MADIAELGYRVDSSELNRATAALDKNSSAATKATDASKKLEQEYAKTSASLQRDIALLGKSGKAAALRYDLENGALKNLAPARKANLLALAQEHDRTEKLLKTARQFGLVIGTTLVAGLAASSAALKMSINRMDELSKAAQRVGLPTEELSKLNYAAGLADVSIDTLTQGLGLLTKSQAAALKETSKQARVFDALDISIKNADGTLRSSGDVLADFADRFKALKGSPEAMAAGFALFGRSFQQLIPLLKDGGDGIREAGEELEAFGGVLSTEAGANAEQFNDNLQRLQTAARSLAQAVASDLLPDLVALTENLVKLSKEGGGVVGAAKDIADAFRFAGGLVASFVDNVQGLTYALTGAANALLAVNKASRLDFSGASESMRNARVAFDLADQEQKQIENRLAGVSGLDNSASTGGRRGRSVSIRDRDDQAATNAYTRALQGALGGGAGKAKSGGKSDAQKEADRMEESYKRMVAQLKEQAAMVGVVSEVEKLRYELNHGEMSKLSQAQKDELLNLAQIAEFRKEDLENLEEAIKAEEERLRVVDEATKAYEETNQSILDQITLLGMTADEQEIWNNLAWAGVTAESARGQEIIKNTQLLQETRRAMDEQIEIMDSVRDAGKGLIVDLGNGVKPIDAIADAWERVRQKLLEMAAEKFMDQIFGKSGDPAGGSSGNWLDAIMGMFGGSSGGGSDAGSLMDLFGSSSSFGGGMANGGDIRGGKFYQVGERNHPELLNMAGRQYLIPGDQGNIEPIRGQRRDRKSGNTIINIGVEGKVTRQTRGQIGGDVARSVRESTRNSA